MYDDNAFLYFIIAMLVLGVAYLLYKLVSDLVNPLADRPWLKQALGHRWYGERYGRQLPSRFTLPFCAKFVTLLLLLALIASISFKASG